MVKRRLERSGARSARAGLAGDGTIISPIFRTVQGDVAVIESFRALFGTFPDWEYIGLELLADGDGFTQPFLAHVTQVRDFMGLRDVRRTKSRACD